MPWYRVTVAPKRPDYVNDAQYDEAKKKHDEVSIEALVQAENGIDALAKAVNANPMVEGVKYTEFSAYLEDKAPVVLE